MSRSKRLVPAVKPAVQSDMVLGGIVACSASSAGVETENELLEGCLIANLNSVALVAKQVVEHMFNRYEGCFFFLESS